MIHMYFEINCISYFSIFNLHKEGYAFDLFVYLYDCSHDNLTSNERIYMNLLPKVGQSNALCGGLQSLADCLVATFLVFWFFACAHLVAVM